MTSSGYSNLDDVFIEDGKNRSIGSQENILLKKTYKLKYNYTRLYEIVYGVFM